MGKAAGPSCGPREKEGPGHQHGQGWDICEVQIRIDSSPGSSPCWDFPTGQLPSLHHPGLWFRSYIHIPVLSITFLGTFAIVQRRCRALHRWETADLDGEVPFPKRGAWLLGLQQVLLLLSSPQIPLFPPQLCLNPQGLPSPLHCCTRALSASHSSQAAPSDDLQDQLELVLPYAQSSLMKGPQCLHHYSAFPPVQRKFLFPCRSPIIGVGEEVGRSCTVSLPGEHQELQ